MKVWLVLLLVWGGIAGYASAARIDTMAVPTKAMPHKKLKTCVAVPKGYAQGKKRYPVLYLLHGAGGNYRSWLTKLTDTGLVARLADQYQMLIVMPSGGNLSYYFDSPVQDTSQYETYITRDVVQAVEARYRTQPGKRAVVGFSMGGHGALYLASRHPGLYQAAGSMSGAVDLNARHWARSDTFRAKRDSSFTAVLGPKQDTAAGWPGYSVVTRVDSLKALNIPMMIDCGTEDFLIGANRELHRRLTALKVPHTYLERPGKHDWAYWTEALPWQVYFVGRVWEGKKPVSTK